MAFLGPEEWIYYLGERCLRQLEGIVRIPASPPEEMFGDPTTYPGGHGMLAHELLESAERSFDERYGSHSIGYIIDIAHVIGGTMVGASHVEGT